MHHNASNHTKTNQNRTKPHRTALKRTKQHLTAQHRTMLHQTTPKRTKTAPHRTATHRSEQHRTTPNRITFQYTARHQPVTEPHRTTRNRTWSMLACSPTCIGRMAFSSPTTRATSATVKDGSGTYGTHQHHPPASPSIHQHPSVPMAPSTSVNHPSSTSVYRHHP